MLLRPQCFPFPFNHQQYSDQSAHNESIPVTLSNFPVSGWRGLSPDDFATLSDFPVSGWSLLSPDDFATLSDFPVSEWSLLSPDDFVTLSDFQVSGWSLLSLDDSETVASVHSFLRRCYAQIVNSVFSQNNTEQASFFFVSYLNAN